MHADTSRHATVDCDVLVIGSGAAGLSAAVTAAWHGQRVIVVEKDEVFGGATAWSGGWMWCPAIRWRSVPGLLKTAVCRAPTSNMNWANTSIRR